MPLRVSISAGWPTSMSRASVSATLQFRLETSRVGDARQVLSRRHPLAHFDRHLLQHAGKARRDLQRPQPAGVRGRPSPAPDRRWPAARASAPRWTRARPSRRRASMSTRFFSVSALRCDCLRISSETSCSLASASLASASIAPARSRIRCAAACACWVSRSFCSCARRLSSAGPRRLQREPRVERFLLDLRVAQDEDDRVGRDGGARPQQDALDAALRWWPAASACLRAPACRRRAPAG